MIDEPILKDSLLNLTCDNLLKYEIYSKEGGPAEGLDFLNFRCYGALAMVPFSKFIVNQLSKLILNQGCFDKKIFK